MKKFLSVIITISLIFNFCPVTGATENYLEKCKEKCLSILKSKTVLKVAGGVAAGVSGMGILALVATNLLGHRESEQGGSKKCGDTNDSSNDSIDDNDLEICIKQLGDVSNKIIKCMDEHEEDIKNEIIKYMDEHKEDIKNEIKEIEKEEIKKEEMEEIEKQLNIAGIRRIRNDNDGVSERFCKSHKAAKENFYYKHWEYFLKLYDDVYEKYYQKKSREEKLKEYYKITAKDCVMFTFMSYLKTASVDFPEVSPDFIAFRSMLNKVNCGVYGDKLCNKTERTNWLNLQEGVKMKK